MNEEREVWEALVPTGFLHALRDAHEKQALTVHRALSREAGFGDRSYGYTSHDVLETELDRAFGLNGAERTSFTGVVRDNLHGSPGWRYGRHRVLLKHYMLGTVDGIRWDRESATKQQVSQSDYPDDPQLKIDLGLILAPADGIATLVLAHTFSEDPFELELYLGRPRFNPGGGPPWWWRRELTRESLGPDPRSAQPIPDPAPRWADTDTDVPLRLKRDENGEAEAR